MTEIYDVILIGAGSIGTPAAFFLAKNGFKVLVVDQFPSHGQGSNKSAIGGIRATHTHPGKILLCQESLGIFSSWEETYGDPIEWFQGGYSFVAYNDEILETLKSTLEIQRKYNAAITWLDARQLLEKIPSLNPEGLRGGTFSLKDGSASPLKASHAFYRQALINNAEFHFSEAVTAIIIKNGQVQSISTNKGHYACKIVVNCAGAWGNDIAQLSKTTLPVKPNAHEAGVTEPVTHFLDPMLVDMRSTPTTTNFYFYQHKTGQIIFCSTPLPDQWGFDTRETSNFLPAAARRMLTLIPGLKNVRVRRTWRGLYPMTPDGSPLLGWDREINGVYIAAGMCGQGFMLGPGIGELLVRVFNETTTGEDTTILQSLDPYRNFNTVESLK